MRPHLFPYHSRFRCGKLAIVLTACTATWIGCGPSKEASPPTPQPGPATSTAPPVVKPFTVALVMSGPTSDNGWNAGAYKGLQAVQQELGLGKDDVAEVDNQKDAAGQEKNLREFAKDHSVVIGHGHEYQEPAKRMAADFPNTLFVISSGDPDAVGKNITPIVLQLEDGAYLEGMLAAGMSKTGKIGLVGAEKIPPLISVFDAFTRGAKAVNPNIQVLQAVFTNDWDSPNKAKSATLPLIDQGADVIMQDVDAAAQGVFNAVQERNRPDKPLYAMGTNNDQNAAAPDVILASAPIYIDKAFIAITKQAKAGTYTPNATPFDMKSGVIGFVLNPKLESKIPAALKSRIAEAQQKLQSGALKVTGAP